MSKKQASKHEKPREKTIQSTHAHNKSLEIIEVKENINKDKWQRRKVKETHTKESKPEINDVKENYDVSKR